MLPGAGNFRVWTGTQANGTKDAAYLCQDWTVADLSGMIGRKGNLTQIDADWTYSNLSTNDDGKCGLNNHRLYCFEQ